MPERNTVTIIYKSGAKVKVECDDCIITHSGTTLTKITIIGGKPRALHFGLDDIVGVWEGDA